MPPAPASNESPGEPPSAWAQRLAFGVPVLVKAFLTLWLIAAGRQVIGHDAFQYFTLQHVFFEQRAIGGEVAWWLPFMTQGTVSNWWMYVQASPLATVALATGWIPRSLDSLTLFHLGLLAMELLFLTGIWLVSKQYVKAPEARFFALMAAATTTIWVDQVWYNLHQIWAVPLILYLVRRFLETGAAWSAGLAVHLLGIQGLGNMPYVLTFQALVVTAYTVSLVVIERELRAGLLKKLMRGHVILAIVFASLVGLAPGYLLVKHGTADIVMLTPGRQPDGTVSLDTFLGYGGHTGILKWVDTFTGLSPALDVKLAFGACTWPLALFGILTGRRRALPLAVTLLFVFMLSAGYFPAHAVYYGWPLMKYFRHLGLMAPFARPFLIVLAGIGLEALLRGRAERWAVGLTARLALYGGIACLWLALDSKVAHTIAVNASHMRPAPGFEIGVPPDHHALRLAISGLATIVTAAAFFLRNRAPSPGRLRFGVAVLLLAHIVDTSTFAVQHLLGRTVVLSKEGRASLGFTPDPFPERRLVFDGGAGSPTLGELFVDRVRPSRLEAIPDRDAVHGLTNWSIFSFLRVDEAGSAFRVDHWLRPFDDLLFASWGQDPGSRGERRGFQPMRRLAFPEVPWLRKVAGVSEDKLQFFGRAEVFPAAVDVSRALRRPSFDGDTLLLYGPGTRPAHGEPGPESAAPNRLRLPFRVLRFDANTLEVDVENEPAPAWLAYADIWHPSWKAWVNDRPAPIAVAQLAYKAVRLDPGRNRVRFHFEPEILPWALRVAGTSALFWLVFAFSLAARELLRPRG